MRRILAALALAVAASAATASAEHYPNRPIKIVVPLPAGSTIDYVARVYATQWEKALGAPIVIENRVGAAGLLAGKYLYKAKPDGYTAGFVLQAMLSKDVVGSDYDPLRLAYSTYVSSDELYLVVPAHSPIKDVAGLIRANPDLYGIVSVGARFAGLQFASAMGLASKLYPSTEGSLLLDIRSGRVGYAFVFDRDARTWAKNGDVRVLAIVSPERSKYLPDLPTISEAIRAAGKAPYPTIPYFSAIAFPPGTPEEIVRRFSDATCRAADSDAVQAKLSDILPTSCSSPQKMRALAERMYQETLPQ